MIKFVVCSAKGVTTNDTKRTMNKIISTYRIAIARDLGILRRSILVTIGERADMKITAMKIKIITSLIKNNAHKSARKAVRKKIVLWEMSIL